ncbi:type II toxin-antitoxin system RelE/ParE family toxin [Companilactobacillus sp.]|jgi:phage-related protein|uniref:type II toxin-antitoxin system RelE/ParE family toxin n=1 Tax=Companilactobacillus sp. TaxID=2767905 RepID=UPI0025BA31BC|nr:type II toxin-antitoxin system RelE/ParE family toxin [Companilactobacillus sp.]MCH4009963.1 type II toxin-antitoxin system RelE/ParE family toxin [Companilactobacillus sp.]MCH4052361.1 type II toxin-antitoxin system RelE/ParE family toxin [Companilactobacillus sp.]MCH4077905.1 type II toxin-antitoxin system RelE/ParE family toxin [Companilactobacillus sp.]MCH4126481.1 type II toxin-antitoxin system RelE/ParE family toxin [Companilactobacillus sp.]MCH4132067.1 type II toxin-antitoxin system
MKKPEFEFYTRPNGTNEMKNFLEQLSDKDKIKLLIRIDSVQEYGLLFAQKLQWIKKINTNLYEIRSQVSSNIQRAVYFHVDGNRYIITHGFTKKTRKTPRREIEHALKMRQEFFSNEDGGND